MWSWIPLNDVQRKTVSVYSAIGAQIKKQLEMHTPRLKHRARFFSGAEIGPCTWCCVEHGASAAHFLQCTTLKDLRDPFKEQPDIHEALPNK
jgi:hypothetical protein